MTLQEQMEAIYRPRDLDRVPWNIGEPPEILVGLVRSGRVSSCDAVDLGCGAGNYAVWLALQGFRVTGLDLSPSAVALAAELAARKGAACRFVTQDILGDVGPMRELFDFAFDWEVLHHVFPPDREIYTEHVHSMLRPGAAYLSVCFSDTDTEFGGTGKHRQTPIGTTLYFSSQQELRDLFERHFLIEDLRTEAIAGRQSRHRAVVALLRRL